MKKKILFGLFVFGLFLAPSVEAAGLGDRVNEAFRGGFGRNPNRTENVYWLSRVVSGEKTTFEALQGAMFYHKALGKTIGDPASAAVAAGKSSGGTTDKNKLIKDVLTLFEKNIGNNPSASEKAWWRKRISCGEIKNEKDLVNSMKYHKSKGVRKGKDTICGGKGVSAPAGVTAKSVAGFSDHPLGDTVRVGIYNAGGGEVIVTANGAWQVRAGNEVKAKLDAGATVKVKYSGGVYNVRGAVSFDDPQEIRMVPVGGSIMQVKSFSDPSVSFPGKNYNRFRGVIEVRKCDGCSEVWVINEVRAEEYAKGLGETLAKDPEAKEYYKALATAARSYALYHRNVTGGRKPKQGYDIGATALDQIYRGYEFELIVPRLVEAVNATRGTIVTDKSGNTPLITTYFSDSGGNTKTAKEVWGSTAERHRHLQKSVSDPHHSASSCRGHCVGLSAQGAFGFAKKDGWSFSRILQYYYDNVRLIKAY